MRSRVLSLAVSSALVAGGLAAGAASASAPGPGTHDTLFPGQGHGGYDALAYDVSLRYQPSSNHLDAVTVLKARPTVQRLRHLTLDLAGLHVRQVKVDGRAAAWHRDGHDLTVRPAKPLTRTFHVRVRYDGVPKQITDADGSTEGWVRTSDGAIGLGEPVGTMAWVPCDNTPGDKATWTFHVDVPSSRQVAANGDLVSRRKHGSRTTWLWRERDPMTTYLATVAIGHFDVHRSSITSVDGRTIPVDSFVDPTSGSQADARAQLPAVVAFEEKRFGPYPFSSTGMIVDDADVGYALETQTRPFYPGSVTALVHEMAHQWFGDSVSVVDWHDLWLAEGFATYAEWLWHAAHGGQSTQQAFDQYYAEPASSSFWRPAPRSFTDSADLFGDPVYVRGAMTLQVLRNRVGDPAFFQILKAWAARHRHGNVHTSDLLRLSERISGKQLDGLFHTWLDKNGKPQGY